MVAVAINDDECLHKRMEVLQFFIDNGDLEMVLVLEGEPRGTRYIEDLWFTIKNTSTSAKELLDVE